MTNSKYADFTKDQLVAEIKNRRTAGRIVAVDLRATNEVLITALETDDGETPEEEAEQERQALTGELHNQLLAPGELPSTNTVPSDEVFADGFRAKHRGDGYVYQVAYVPEDATRPYKARIPKQASGHPGLFWEGSEEEFQASFAKL